MQERPGSPPRQLLEGGADQGVAAVPSQDVEVLLGQGLSQVPGHLVQQLDVPAADAALFGELQQLQQQRACEIGYFLRANANARLEKNFGAKCLHNKTATGGQGETSFRKGVCTGR